MFLLFIVITLAGIAEGLGLSMLIPLLDYEAAQAGEATSRYAQIIYGFMESVGSTPPSPASYHYWRDCSPLRPLS